jgi:hypothetical protein
MDKRILITVTSFILSVGPHAWATGKTKSADASQTKERAANTWPAETLKGTIEMVDPDMKLVVVKDASGVPFDFRVNHFTRIGTRRVSSGLGELKPDVNRMVSVQFVPERRGDVARSIELTQ